MTIKLQLVNVPNVIIFKFFIKAVRNKFFVFAIFEIFRVINPSSKNKKKIIIKGINL